MFLSRQPEHPEMHPRYACVFTSTGGTYGRPDPAAGRIIGRALQSGERGCPRLTERGHGDHWVVSYGQIVVAAIPPPVIDRDHPPASRNGPRLNVRTARSWNWDVVTVTNLVTRKASAANTRHPYFPHLTPNQSRQDSFLKT